MYLNIVLENIVFENSVNKTFSKNYIQINTVDGCSSYIGMITEGENKVKQGLSLADGCLDHDIIQVLIKMHNLLNWLERPIGTQISGLVELFSSWFG